MDMFISNSFLIDGLINISNVDFTTTTTTPSSSSTDSQRRHQPLLPPPQNPFHHHNNQSSSTTFSNDFFLPSLPPTPLSIYASPYENDDVVEPEWLSQFVDYCFHYDFRATGETMVVGSSVPQSDDKTFTRKTDHHGKRSRAPGGKSRPKTEPDGGSSWSKAAPGEGSGVRRCTHCASKKTPQWRSGPLGPKTLCNACGVRYKSGRLVAEYRPASSPTFMLSQHSNSHRKVLELRRQKELVMIKQEAQ